MHGGRRLSGLSTDLQSQLFQDNDASSAGKGISGCSVVDVLLAYRSIMVVVFVFQTLEPRYVEIGGCCHAVELLDRVNIKHDNGTECNVVGEPKGMEHLAFVNKILHGVSDDFGGCDAFLDVRAESLVP